jgi:hypothetical protein
MGELGEDPDMEMAELLDVLSHVVFAVTPKDETGLVDLNNLPDMVRSLVSEKNDLRAERDRLRTAIVAVHNELVGALAANASSDIVESVRRLRAERDRLRAVVDAALSGLSLMAVEAKCHDDVLISADLYAALSRQLDATPTEEDT